MVTKNDIVCTILRENDISIAIDEETGFPIAYYPDRVCKLVDIAFILWKHAAHMEFYPDIRMGAQFGGNHSGVLIKWDKGSELEAVYGQV